MTRLSYTEIENTFDIRITKNCFKLTGNYQSWSPGWETRLFQNDPRYTRVIPQLETLFKAPGAVQEDGHFITYIRAPTDIIGKSEYFVICQINQRKDLPPSVYRYTKQGIDVCVSAIGKLWGDGELVSELTMFKCDSYE